MFSFPSSAWEREGAKLRFAANSGQEAKQSFATCVPKQSLGTRRRMAIHLLK